MIILKYSKQNLVWFVNFQSKKTFSSIFILQYKIRCLLMLKSLRTCKKELKQVQNTNLVK